MKFHLKCTKDQLYKNSEELYCQACFVEPGPDKGSDVDTDMHPNQSIAFVKNGDSRSSIKILMVYLTKSIKSGYFLLVSIEMFMLTA